MISNNRARVRLCKIVDSVIEEIIAVGAGTASSNYGYYMLFTGFSPSVNVATIVLNSVIEIIPAASY